MIRVPGYPRGMSETKPKEKMGCLKKLLLAGSVGAAVLVLGTLLLYLLWFVPAVNEKPVLERDYLAEWQGAEVAGDESTHAWPVMVRGVRELGKAPSREIDMGIGRVFDQPIGFDTRPGDDGWDEIEAYLGQEQINAALDRLREVTGKSVLGYRHTNEADPDLRVAMGASNPEIDITVPEPSDRPAMFSLILSYVGIGIEQGRTLSARAYLRGFAGEYGQESVGEIEAAIAIGRHLERQRSGIVSRAGIEIVGRAAETALETLARDADSIGAETLAGLDAVMAAWHGREPVDPFAYAVLSGRDLLQRVYDADGNMTAFGVVAMSQEELELYDSGSMLSNPDEGLGSQPFWVKGYGVFARGAYPSREELEDLIDRFEPLGQAFGELEPWEADPAVDPVKSIYEVVREAEQFGNVPLQIAYAHSIASGLAGEGAEAVSRVSAVRLAIAAIGHRNETGDWPRTADELGDGSAWPDGFSGEPLRLIPGESGIVIYSVGTDRNDDGGRVCEEPTQYWWPANAAKMEAADPEEYDGDWVLWTPDLDEVRTAEREAEAAEYADE
ncbi:MAG: hypothetical protein ACF8Q5_00785 [Phycisphaerales bacterium JB040]